MDARQVVAGLTCLLAIACSEPPASTVSPRVTPDGRLVMQRYNVAGWNGDPGVWFIRDSDSNDCWIFVSSNSGAALQPASTESCTRGERRGAALTDRRPDGSP